MSTRKNKWIWPLFWFIGTPVVLAGIIFLFFVSSNQVVKEEKTALQYSLTLDEKTSIDFDAALKEKSTSKSLKYEKNTVVTLLTDDSSQEQLHCFSTKKGQLDCWLQSTHKPTCETAGNNLQNFLVSIAQEKNIQFICKPGNTSESKS
ncbi:hypothetical protein [Undibacterium sp. TS12]|uniref:hypothetical protein n=1 Tax=Undibacterium sp. TS12 TaxID=2908202 RepID=UPI001F4CF607|nr:hypothetical protein [Undibacterium sp. TS12]MCH8622624.1 hypothetical protein [Undibacterium sp. TS12]